MNKDLDKAKFQFKDYALTDIRFQIHSEWNPTTEETPLRVKIGVTVALPENEDMVDNGGVELSCSINEDEQSKVDTLFELNVMMRGHFVASEKMSRANMQHTLQINGVAAMLPFLRSAVSNLTTTSNVPTVILPMVNVHSLMKNV